MKITDERTSQAFEYVDDGVAFEYDGCIYMKLDREVKGVVDCIVYNDTDLAYIYRRLFVIFRITPVKVTKAIGSKFGSIVFSL